jgi:hypothetical protein
MDTYDTMFSASYTLNEQIARQVFEVLPEQGPIVAIMDRDGNCWPNHSEEFTRLSLGEPPLADFRAMVDDGVEPVVAQIEDTSVIVAQLATEQTNCGYVIVALPRHGTKLTPAETDLAEALISQIALIARLVEKNSRLTEARARYYGAADCAGACLTN